jgi:hypothetical protein
VSDLSDVRSEILIRFPCKHIDHPQMPTQDVAAILEKDSNPRD